MPHFVIDCSENVLHGRSQQEILKVVHATADATALFETADIKVRLRPFEEFSVGGGKSDFIHVFADIMEGRTTEQKAHLSKEIVSKLKAMFPEVPFIAMNVRDFEKATYCNRAML